MNGTLSSEERGLVAGLLRLGLEKPAVDRVLATAEAVQAWTEAGALPDERRETAAADLLQDALGPVPAGVAGLHPSWLREALAAEPTGLALALAEGTVLAGAAAALVRSRGEPGGPWPLEPDLRQQLRRVVLAPLEALAAEPAGPLGRELAALTGQALELEVCRWGARAVGASLAGAPLELRARAMASAGAPWSVEIAAAAARPTEPAARERARQQVARAAARPALTPVQRLQAVGLLALREALADEGTGSLRRVAGALPVDLGRALLIA